jgi:tetratricopeptide (TPR) repeat protein
LAKIDPRNSQWQRDGAYFLDRIGDECRKLGMNQRAIAAYEESLAVWRQLAKIDRQNSQRQLNVSVTLDKLGEVKLDANDDTGALAAYEESLTIHRDLSKSDPNNPNRQLKVAESLEKIGDLRLEAGDVEGALVAYREMLFIDRRLAAADGSNREWQRNLSLSLERFGDVTLTVGNIIAAVAAYEECISLHRRLAASCKTDTQWQKEVYSSLERISRLKESVAIRRTLAEHDKDYARCQWDVLHSLEKVAKMRLRSGDTQGGLAALAEILAITRNLVQTDKSNIEWQRGASANRLTSATLGIRAALLKFSAPSLPKLISATRYRSGRYLRASTLIVGRSSIQVRTWCRGLQSSAATLRKSSVLSLPKLIATTRRLSERYLRIGSVIIGKLSAQVRTRVLGMQRSAELKGFTLKWSLLASSSSYGASSLPKHNEPESSFAFFQHEGSVVDQSLLLDPIGQNNTANNALAASASSAIRIDQTHDATCVDASMVTGGRTCKMDIQTRRNQSPATAESPKRRRRKRKGRGLSSSSRERSSRTALLRPNC